MDDESGESMEPMEEVPLIELGEAELEISAWLTEGSRELILTALLTTKISYDRHDALKKLRKLPKGRRPYCTNF